MSVVMEGMLSTHWQYSRIILINSNTVLQERKSQIRYLCAQMKSKNNKQASRTDRKPPNAGNDSVEYAP